MDYMSILYWVISHPSEIALAITSTISLASLADAVIKKPDVETETNLIKGIITVIKNVLPLLAINVGHAANKD